MPTPSDPYYYNTVLHLPFDSDLRDKSLFGNAVTAFGNVAVTTAEKKHGPGSAVFDGSTGYLTPLSQSQTLAEDFCIELWMRSSTDTSAMAVFPRLISSVVFPVATSLQIRLRGNPSVDPDLDAAGVLQVLTDVVVLSSANPLNDGLWHHIAVTRQSGVMRLFVDGASQGSVASTVSFSMPIGTRIGSREDNAGYFTGHLDDFRITKGVARYTENFTPPGAIEYFNWDDPVNITPSTAESYTFAPYAPPRSVHLPTVAPDPISGIRGGTEYGGRGRIVGTVKNKGEPSDTPVYRRVRLFKDRDGQCVAETWSNPVTGAYAFENINPAHKYTALSYDHTGQFRAVVADNLPPEVF